MEIKINIEKKAVWILSLIIVLGLGGIFAFALTGTYPTSEPNDSSAWHYLINVVSKDVTNNLKSIDSDDNGKIDKEFLEIPTSNKTYVMLGECLPGDTELKIMTRTNTCNGVEESSYNYDSGYSYPCDGATTCTTLGNNDWEEIPGTIPTCDYYDEKLSSNVYNNDIYCDSPILKTCTALTYYLCKVELA